MNLILASSSKSRLDLLKSINIIPDKIISPDIVEIPNKDELPRHFASRMAKEKAEKIAVNYDESDKAIIIAADTVVVTGGKMLNKTNNKEDIISSISKLSNKRHILYSAICVIKKQIGKKTLMQQKIVKNIIKFRKITDKEIEYYANLQESLGSAGGYVIEKYAASFVEYIAGSDSAIKGLPLCGLMQILHAFGYYVA